MSLPILKKKKKNTLLGPWTKVSSKLVDIDIVDHLSIPGNGRTYPQLKNGRTYPQLKNLMEAMNKIAQAMNLERAYDKMEPRAGDKIRFVRKEVMEPIQGHDSCEGLELNQVYTVSTIYTTWIQLEEHKGPWRYAARFDFVSRKKEDEIDADAYFKL